MARIRLLTLLLLPLLFVGCSDDDDPVQPFADFDRTARFLEDSEPFQAILEEIDDDRARNFIADNSEIDTLLEFLAALPYYAKPSEQESAAIRQRIEERVPLGRGKADFGGPNVDYGTYVLSLGEWVLDDPSSPTDAALFVFTAEDGLLYENAQGLIVVVEGELEYSHQELVFTETEYDARETIEIRIAEVGPPLKGVQFDTILRFYDRLYFRDSGTERVFGIERGDKAAAGRTASARASWIGGSMLFSEGRIREYMDGEDGIGEFRAALQYYATGIGGLFHIADGGTERRPPVGDTVEIPYSEIGFGLTSTPSVIPWLVFMEREYGVEFDVYTGEVRFRGRRVGDIDGTSNEVACPTCVPAATCDDIWVTWTNDSEDPVLLCILTQNFVFF